MHEIAWYQVPEPPDMHLWNSWLRAPDRGEQSPGYSLNSAPLPQGKMPPRAVRDSESKPDREKVDFSHEAVSQERGSDTWLR